MIISLLNKKRQRREKAIEYLQSNVQTRSRVGLRGEYYKGKELIKYQRDEVIKLLQTDSVDRVVWSGAILFPDDKTVNFSVATNGECTIKMGLGIHFMQDVVCL